MIEKIKIGVVFGIVILIVLGVGVLYVYGPSTIGNESRVDSDDVVGVYQYMQKN